MPRDITNWLEKRIGPSKLANNGYELRYCCPLCDDMSFHFYYNPKKDVWLCFKCDEKGNGLDIIMRVDNVSALEAAKLQSPHVYKPAPPPKVITELPAWYRPLVPKPEVQDVNWKLPYYYTQHRGFTDQDIEFYGFGYVKGDYIHRCRLILPVERGYYQARATSDSQKPKYINPDVPKGDRLFNYKILGQPHIAICEGCFSAIAATKHGSVPALAILGKNPLMEQLRRIAMSKPAAIDIAFDAGTEASDATISMAGYFYSLDIQVMIRAYKFGDPDECNEYALYRYTDSYKMRARLTNLKIL